MPTDLQERNRFLNYKRDPNTPKHQIRWNWIVDIPLGRGKKFAGNASGVADKLLGGWQIAGTGNWRTTYFTLPTNLYQTTGRRLRYMAISTRSKTAEAALAFLDICGGMATFRPRRLTAMMLPGGQME